MKLAKWSCGVVMVAGLSSALASCTSQPDATATTPSFVVRGKVMTGAHAHVPVAGGYVGLVLPSMGGLYVAKFATSSQIPNKVVTAADGTFVFKVEAAFLTYAQYYPIYVGASDAAGTFTMLAEIPYDLAAAGADLQRDITPTTTAASQLVCPGGVYLPPAGTYCFIDAKGTSKEIASFEATIEASLAGPNATLEPGTPPSWATFMTALLADVAAFNALQAEAQSIGLDAPGFTKTAVPSAIGKAPRITAPVPGVDDNMQAPGTSSGGTSGGTTTACVLHWDCGSSTQCAQAFGAATGDYPEMSSAACEAFRAKSCSGSACQCRGCTN